MGDNFNYSLTCSDLPAEIWMGQTRNNYSQSHQHSASQTSRHRGEVLAFKNLWLVSPSLSVGSSQTCSPSLCWLWHRRILFHATGARGCTPGITLWYCVVEPGNTVWRKELSDVRKDYFRISRTQDVINPSCTYVLSTWTNILCYSPVPDTGSNFFNKSQIQILILVSGSVLGTLNLSINFIILQGWISLFFWNQEERTIILWLQYMH